jgi:hypothetical protein
MWLIGTVYNFCRAHRSLRLRAENGATERRRIERTPAQAAGLTDHRWSLYELLSFTVPPTPPKRRGRRPRWLSEAAHAACLLIHGSMWCYPRVAQREFWYFLVSEAMPITISTL